MIKFVIKGKKNPQKKTETKYYAQAAAATPLTLPQIVKLIEKRSTVSSSDIKAVLDALQFEIIQALQNGNSVRLGDHQLQRCRHAGRCPESRRAAD